ncbi:MAG: hypothetical protein HWE10_07610 [Gammaproteobacteria bacterium]|nr:hypothetical protein [Gammaproteobacteria bacterium]
MMISIFTLSLIAFAPVVSLSVVYAVIVVLKVGLGIEVLPFLDSAE